MAVPIIKTSFSAGELSPALFGHTDFAKFGLAASTMRNMMVNYRGGAYSRPGTEFVGWSRQLGRGVPPRLIPFQFSVNQGLALEFGHQYMRVIYDGGFVVDRDIPITGATKSNVCTLTLSNLEVKAASPNTGGVTASYRPGEIVRLAGGDFETRANLTVATTTLLHVEQDESGDGYAPGDIVFLRGGTQSSPASVLVGGAYVYSATVETAGTAGLAGVATVRGTTGVGTLFEASVVIADDGSGYGGISSITSITVPGAYSTGPTDPDAEPVVAVTTTPSDPGYGLTGAKLTLVLRSESITLRSGGAFTANSTGAFTQGSTTGSGTGMTFKNGLFGPRTMTVSEPGVYNEAPDQPVQQYNTTNAGEGATFNVAFGNILAAGDWFQMTGVVGMTELNGRTFVVHNATPTTVRITDPYGHYINSSAYSPYLRGGTASRLFTLDTPWSEDDLAWLKWTQSADVLTIGCWNQDTGTSYPVYEIHRTDDAAWTISTPSFGASIEAPTHLTAHATPKPTGTNYEDPHPDYKYCVTAVSSVDGSESVASDIVDIYNCVDIAQTAGSIALQWTAVENAKSYNVYKALPSYFGTKVPTGAMYGYIGTAFNVKFNDSNITPDFQQSPPIHNNPFESENPSVPAYYQQRRFYAASPQHPNTFWASRPGDYRNFDTRIPTMGNDALEGTPWSVQVNGIQHMIPMPGGLVILTGTSAWQLSAAGSSAGSPLGLTPANQQAQPQAFNGISPTVPPIKIDFEILYVQSKGSIVRDLSYNYWMNIYTGVDITQLSSHLFAGYTLKEWAWCEEPYKTAWAVRNDGTLLSLAFLKQQEVMGWARHDTRGKFCSVCSVVEPPVDSLYTVVERVTPRDARAFLIERMNNRLWTTAETCWCVDAGLTTVPRTPSAVLTASSHAGEGAIIGVADLIGGSNYSSSTTAAIVDDNGQGPGTGAAPQLTITDGVITAVAFPGAAQGSGYTYPAIVFTDPTGAGSGASATPTLDNWALFGATDDVFSTGMTNWVIRAGGGRARITEIRDSRHVIADIMDPIVAVIPNGEDRVFPFQPGEWSLAGPLTTISGLEHLAGMEVTGLADGNVITPRVVDSYGSITLDTPASLVTVGLGFTAQLQSTYLDVGQPTVQGQRKRVAVATARIEASRGLQMGSNQPDGSALSPPRVEVRWTNLSEVPDIAKRPYNSPTMPLYTGDVRVPIGGGFAKPGQVALQQAYPLPMRVLALIPEVDPGDMPQTPGPARQQQGRRQ